MGNGKHYKTTSVRVGSVISVMSELILSLVNLINYSQVSSDSQRENSTKTEQWNEYDIQSRIHTPHH